MWLNDKYYMLAGCDMAGDSGTFRIVLLPDCDVYRGHFPGHPVCPGVCNMGVVRECASMLAGRPLSVSTVSQCRFLAVASPLHCREMEVRVTMQPAGEGRVRVTARLCDAEKTYMEYKGEMTL